MLSLPVLRLWQFFYPFGYPFIYPIQQGRINMTGTFLRRIVRIALVLLVLLFLAAAALLIWLSIFEYTPPAAGPASADSRASAVLHVGEPFSIMTWNTGYCALGDNSDFFMDGGKQVKTASYDRVQANLEAISGQIAVFSPDILVLQEVDLNSDRSYGINTYERLSAVLPGYDRTFAANFRVPFVPYPIPPVGRVDSGIATLSRFSLTSSERLSLPCPFSWPARLANLKRCLLVSRIPLPETEHELVLINLHLEAFDDGSGKAAQTAMLRQIMDAELEKGNYLIVGGDFNQVFSNIDISSYPTFDHTWQPGSIDITDFPDSFHFLMDSTFPTCRSLDRVYAGADPASFQYYMIDGFIVSSNVQVISLETQNLNFTSSDHNPVLLHASLLP